MGLMDWGMDKVKNMGVWDVGAFKIFMFTFGLLVGAYAWTFVRKFYWLFGAIFVIALLWMLYVMFVKK